MSGLGLSKKCRDGAAALLLAWGCGAACAQAAKPPSELATCAAGNRQAMAELTQSHEGEIRRHTLHAVLVARLQGLNAQFAPVRAQVARPPRNLADCEQTRQAVANAREQLERVVGTPAQVGECNTSNQQTYTEMQQALLTLQSGGKVSNAALEPLAARLELLRGALARDGSLADCRQLTADLAREKTEVQRLLPSAPAARPPVAAASAPTAGAPAVAAVPAAECRTAQGRSYNEIAQAYAKLVGGGPIPPDWMSTLQSLSERLTRLHAAIADTNAPGWDCEGIQRALAQARADLGQLRR